MIEVVGAEIETETPVRLMSDPRSCTPVAPPTTVTPPPTASMVTLCIALRDTDRPFKLTPFRPDALTDPGELSDRSARLDTLVCPMLCMLVPSVDVMRMFSACTENVRASIETASAVWVMTLSPWAPLTRVVSLTPSIVIDC